MNTTLIASNKTACALSIPFAHEVLSDKLPQWARGLLVAFAVCCIVSVLVFVDEVIFLVKSFRNKQRLVRTLWVLAVFPVYTLTAYLSLLIPRSGTLINLVANSFLASVIYQLVELIVDYLGGRDKMWIIIGGPRPISIRTPPLCCCCLCLPDVTLTRKTFEKFYNLVMQVTICRPMLMFIAAVLWTDNTYVPGYLLPNNAFLYVSVANLTSTVLAIWGLVILKTGFQPELQKQYLITGKIACIQLTLFSTAIASLICGILATTNVIGCTGLLSSKARGDALFHMVLVVWMTLLGLVARRFYRRESDAADNDCFDLMIKIAASTCPADAEAGNGRIGKAGESGSIKCNRQDPNSNITRTGKDSGRINEAATTGLDNSISDV